MISPSEREFVLSQLDRTRERILGNLQGLSPDQLLFRPEPGCWSIAEHVEHLVIAEKLRVAAIDKLLQEPPDLSQQSSVSDEELVRQVGTVVERVQAPPHVLPTLRWPPEELWREFETTRRQTRDFTVAINGDLRHHFIGHFLFGNLDCYQWLLLIGAHCNRHSTHIEGVKTAPGFPL
ncbi:MAG TPA: DinB family protein [Blastocatellia bacterium]|nr:DinB family protein [Blastocatellia bacterium]